MSPIDEKHDHHAEEIDEKELAYAAVHIDDPALEKKIVAHLDRRILPWIFLLWLLAFIDRSNVSFTFSQGHDARDTDKARSATPKSTA